MIYAAVMFIVNFNGFILGVSRRKNPNKFGLPRGEIPLPKLALVKDFSHQAKLDIKGFLQA